VLELLDKLVSDDDHPGVGVLRGWDGALEASSGAAALFEVWHRRHLRPALLKAALRQLLPEERVDAALHRVLPDESLLADSRVLLSLIDAPGKRLGPDPDAVLTDVLSSSLQIAYDDCCSLLGEDPHTWQWGDLHVSVLRHAMDLRLAGTSDVVSVGPVPRGGSGDTVCDTAYDAEFVQTGGSTFRVVLDVGQWDESLALNSPGQAGDPRSSHFDDLHRSWSRGEYFPLLYSRGAVERETEFVWVLQPLQV
jgi:penicillin amidase